MTAAPLILTTADLESLAVFPLPNAVLFPGVQLPLHVFEPRYQEMLRDVLRGPRFLAIARLKPGYEANYHGRPPMYEVCGVGGVVESTERPDGRYDIVVRGVCRALILEEHPPLEAYRRVRLEVLHEVQTGSPATLVALQRKVSSLWDKLKPHLPISSHDLESVLRGAEGAGAAADRLSAALVSDPDERQRLLEELDPSERLSRLVERLDELIRALTAETDSPRDLN